MNHWINSFGLLGIAFCLTLSGVGYCQDSQPTDPTSGFANRQRPAATLPGSSETRNSGTHAFDLALSPWTMTGTESLSWWQDIPDLSPARNAFGLLYIEASAPSMRLPGSEAFSVKMAANPLLDFGRAGEFAGELARKFNIEFTLKHRVLRLSSYETARDWVSGNAFRLNISTKLDGK